MKVQSWFSELAGEIDMFSILVNSLGHQARVHLGEI